MGLRIAATAVLALIGLTLIVYGVGFLGYALAIALAPSLGYAGGAAVAGGIFVAPPFLWAVLVLLLRPWRKPRPAAPSGLTAAVIGALAKEVPWAAIVGAGAVGIAEMILRRRKQP